MMERQLALLVDGRLDAQPAMLRQLEILGWDALAVNSGAEAVRAAMQLSRLDALLTEVGLPDMDGRGLAAVLCHDRPFTRVVFLADRALPGSDDVAPLLVKPFSTLALRQALAAARAYAPAAPGQARRGLTWPSR